jgi:hypothetical protein
MAVLLTLQSENRGRFDWINLTELSNCTVFLYIPSPQLLVKGFSHATAFLTRISILLAKDVKNTQQRSIHC